MELPIASQSYQPSDAVLLRAVHRGAMVLARTTSDESTFATATAFMSDTHAAVASANAAFDVTDVATIDAVAADFAARGLVCRLWHTQGPAWDAALSAALEARGCVTQRRTLYLLRQYAQPRQQAASVRIIPARALYPQLPEFYRAVVRELMPASVTTDVAAVQQHAAACVDHLDEPRLDVLLGCMPRQPVAVAGVLSLGNIGILDLPFVLEAHRGQGVGAAILAALIDHCQRAQFEQVLLELPTGSKHVGFFTALGFVPLLEYVRYIGVQP